jgi:hypothetical protein
MRTVVLLVSLSLTACTSPFSNSSSKVTKGDFCKIEGSAIGHEGFVLTLGNRAVHFHDWVDKQGSAGEYVGFSLSLSGASSLGYVVKAGTATFHSTAKTWMHPDGQQGKAISNVSFCENCDGGDCGGGDGSGSGSDGECTCDPNGENCTDGSEDDGGLY